MRYYRMSDCYDYTVAKLRKRNGYNMKNLLVGNGINIQFDSFNYTPQQIVLRVLKNCDRDDFPVHIIVNSSQLLKIYIGQLYLEGRNILQGQYDAYAISESEKKSLEAFKEQYASRINTLRITDIGFEDYYLIHDLVCHKTGTNNPEQYHAREGMRTAYLYSIYNDGRVNSLYKRYPKKLVEYLLGFDHIFTTNYDSNLELCGCENVFHIHGQFDKKCEVYCSDSLRNKLPDAPIMDIDIDEEYYYLYSNALTTHSGDYKEFQIKQISYANEGLKKMAVAYNSDYEIRKDVDSWILGSNKLLVNIGHAIKLKAEHPELDFNDNYNFDKLINISGELEMIGLSPWNDLHIFEAINNASLDKCIYYYYSAKDCEVVKSLLSSLAIDERLEFRSVVEFWESCYEE